MHISAESPAAKSFVLSSEATTNANDNVTDVDHVQQYGLKHVVIPEVSDVDPDFTSVTKLKRL